MGKGGYCSSLMNRMIIEEKRMSDSTCSACHHRCRSDASGVVEVLSISGVRETGLETSGSPVSVARPLRTSTSQA